MNDETPTPTPTADAEEQSHAAAAATSAGYGEAGHPSPAAATPFPSGGDPYATPSRSPAIPTTAGPQPVMSHGAVARSRDVPNYKVLLIGDSGVGKSNLLQRFANNSFDINMRSTIGVEFVSREVDLSGGAGTDRANIQLWDTAGQERCGLISSSFYRGAKGVALVYDMTRRASLLNIPRWVAHAKQYADENCVFVVVGNKTDLRNLIAVSDEDAEEISHSLGVRHYYASARTGDGVPDAFFQLILAVHSTAKILATETREREPARPRPVQIGSAKVDTTGVGGDYSKPGGGGCC